MYYYISDLHFNHKLMIEGDNPQRSCYKTVEEMNEDLINNWNNVVTDGDDIFVLGDVVFSNGIDLAKRLKGHKHLIVGNHDYKRVFNTKTPIDKEPVRKDNEFTSLFETISLYQTVTDGDYHIFLCHYPVALWPGKDKNNYNSYHFFGHIHSDRGDCYKYMLSQDKAFNVCVDVIGPKPLTAKEIIEHPEWQNLDNPREFKPKG